MFVNTFFQCFSGFAGVEGFEPPLTVLETVALGHCTIPLYVFVMFLHKIQFCLILAGVLGVGPRLLVLETSVLP